MHQLCSLQIIALALVLALAGGSALPQDSDAEQSVRALELMKKARTTIGGEAALHNLHSLSAKGKLRRFVTYVSVQGPDKIEEKQKTLGGKVEFDFQLPDKFRRRVKGSSLIGWDYSYAEVVNGKRAWRNPPLPVRSAAGDPRIIDVGDVERSFDRMARNARQQIAIYTLAWLLQSPPGIELEFRHLGTTLVDDRRAEAILVQGEEDFNFVLLLDAQTSLPLALGFTFVDIPRETVIVEAASVMSSWLRRTWVRARQERQARTRPPRRREMQLRFSDHRRVNGVLLPHRLTVILDNQITEELTIGEFVPNRKISPKKFTDEPERAYK